MLIRRIELLLLLALTPALAQADYRSVAVPRAVLFDAPSAQAKKLYVIDQGYPVEIVVNLGDWVKVRDGQGGLSWIESARLATQRTVVVLRDRAELHAAADAASPLLGYLAKDVVLELVAAGGGWARVRHRDGTAGYVAAADVWGL